MIKRFATLAAVLALSATLTAQQRPIVGSTVQTLDTTANSLLVGCAVGSTTCTGGVKAGSGLFTTLNNVVGTSATFTGAGVFTVTNTASQAFSVRYNSSNPALGFMLANANGFPYIGFNTKSKVTSDTATYEIAGFASQLRMDNGSFMFLTAPSGSAAADITFSQRWGVNNAGDWTYGASSHIADSGGTPTIASGFGTSPAIAGTDYAFLVTNGTPPNNGTVNFGHTWTTAPVCTVSLALSGGTASAQTVGGLASTTTLIISHSAGGDAGGKISVLCRGY